ncbi:hypothetical protein GHK92_12380 [Nocardioides sp. dk4132]|uniref:hypothetical protein n=1 Tax=unclassified Nocardioides TaxID=2615069 RepID=UPI0012953A68|nr:MULTISPECIES: hypothetical protein [unclassified Nocardioides]MQW76675.1 hypothetical protein [Nocardioides sp. dk4132]QGA06964.1 hypothetical protein GFH29_05840 [Nocardioides sp. dk884]
MTTIPVNETVPGRAGTQLAPQQPSTSAESARSDRLLAILQTTRGVLLALLDLALLHTRSAWAEIRATSPAWFPVVFLTWCGAAAVLAAAFAIWVLVVMLTTG